MKQAVLGTKMVTYFMWHGRSLVTFIEAWNNTAIAWYYFPSHTHKKDQLDRRVLNRLIPEI